MKKEFQISNFKFQITKEKLLFASVFIVLGIVALQIPVNYLAGAKVKFTLFDLFAPITGAFLGSGIGAVAVISMSLINLALHGFAGFNTSNLLTAVATLRIVPLVFGVWFFAYAAQKNASKLILLFPLAAIIIFNLHPAGRGAWVYSMFWLIPLLVWPLRNKSLVARSLGSTFTAHAVGGAIWIWAFNLPSAVWLALLPVTAIERSVFALGMSASYILMNNAGSWLVNAKLLPKGLVFNKKYLIGK